MICENKKFIFIHIPKTAGTSIKNVIQPYGISYVNGHAHTCIKDAQAKKDLSKYFKFAFVRDPWDRAVSMYHYRKNNHPDNKVKKFYSQFKDFRAWVKDFYDNWDEYQSGDKADISPTGLGNDQQIKWIQNSLGNVDIDFIGKFETINESWQRIAKTLNINYEVLPHENATKRKGYASYYDLDTVDMISSLYQQDIELFDYHFNSSF
jgi:hypothetical protein